MGVTISIKCEIDSRVLLYPLMRCLLPFGNCLLVTSNKQVARIIENEFDGYFRNFRVLVDLDGGTDELLEQTGISADEFSYVIYDNVGVVEQTKMLIPIGPIVSDAFESEMLYLGEDKNTHIIRFGKPIRNKNRPTPAPIKGTKVKEALTEEEIEEAAKSKFKVKKEDVTEKLRKLPNINFPSFDDFELLESNLQFGEVDRNLVKFFYAILQGYIGISEPNFIREVTKRDESSSSFEQHPANGENSISVNASQRIS